MIDIIAIFYGQRWKIFQFVKVSLVVSDYLFNFWEKQLFLLSFFLNSFSIALVETYLTKYSSYINHKMDSLDNAIRKFK